MALPDCNADLNGCYQAGLTFVEAGCAPSTNTGEIKYIYIGASALANGTTAEFTTRVDNTGAAIDHIVRLTVIGTMNEPEQTEFALEGGVTGYGTRQFTVEGEWYEDSDEAYEFLRLSQCDKPVLVWFGTDDHIFGGASDWKSGIATVIRVNRVMEGVDTLAKYLFNFSWKSKYSPIRTTNPDPLTGNTVT